jgi:mono/diheme cytochrome c family protein
MKFLKSGLITICFALFVFACNQAANNTANNALSTKNANAPVNSNTLANTNTIANAANAAPADEIASGKAVYMEKCVKCHKENGTGGEIDVMGKKRKAANFTGDSLKKDSDAELIEAIENGVTDEGMPAFKEKLTDEQIKSVVKFIRKEFQGK